MKSLLLLTPLFAIMLSAYDLTIKVDGFKNNQGQLSVGLYIDAKTFPNQDEAYLGQRVTISQKKAVALFKDLPSKTYAVALYHDSNVNDELDKNFLGIPNEAYGFSNNAKGSFGAPSFDQAEFTLTQDITMSITLEN